MKKLILIFWISFCSVFASAQTGKDNLSQTPDLQAAQKISLEVVKLFKEKKFEEALPLAERVVTIRENAQGKNHVQVAQAYRNLGYIQLQRDKRKEAQSAFEKALGIYETNQSLSVQDERTFAEMLEAVALYEALNGDFLGAEKKFNRAVELREKVNGKDALETANAMLQLSQIYQVKGDYEKAAPLLLRALDIKTAKLGKENDQTIEIYDNTFCTLTKLERADEAAQLRNKFYPKKPAEPQTGGKDTIINGGVVNGKALNLVNPGYPYEARIKNVSGAVNVQVKIDETGKVIYACAVSGAKELQRASEISAYQSKFSPTRFNGQLIKVTGIIVYNFIR